MLSPVLTLEKKPVLDPVVRIVNSPLRVPAWAVAIAVLLAGISGFAAGRQKPAHHYVSYFGYPMVLDTTTGKACYAVKPKATDSAAVQDAAYPQGENGAAADAEVPNGAGVPVCGQE